MRRIKFRVYIPDHEKFCYFELGDFDYSDRYLHQNEYPVQQFTGLKAVNVAEGDLADDIYEGDLLQFAYRDDGVKFVGEVRYFEEFACFGVVIDNAFETFQDLIEYDQSFKVVGNIHEK